jgi:hypothetical protein
MAYTITKLPDGDGSLGNWRAELATLQPASSDYATGGYLIQGIAGSTENTGNVGLAKVLFVLAVGGQGGYAPVWNPATSKLQVFVDSTSQGPSGELLPGSNLFFNPMRLLIVGL